MKAHQRIVREQSALTDQSYFPPNPDLQSAIIKETDYQTAKEIIEQYEWLKCMSAITMYCYGIYFNGICGGVVTFGQEYSENRGVWDKYDFTGQMLLLSRGVCLHWTPTNTASKLIMGAIKMLPEKYKVITATTDRLAGEIGTIYQACNFHYVGSMRKYKTRAAWKINGKLYGTRALRAKIGTQKKEEVLKHFPDAIYCEQLSKDRYFYFRGSKKDKKYFQSKIQHIIKPYPKRETVDNTALLVVK